MNSDTVERILTYTASAPLTGSLDWEAVDNGANASDHDYQGGNGTIQLSNWSTATLRHPRVRRSKVESDEMILVPFSNPVNLQLDRSSVTISPMSTTTRRFRPLRRRSCSSIPRLSPSLPANPRPSRRRWRIRRPPANARSCRCTRRMRPFSFRQSKCRARLHDHGDVSGGDGGAVRWRGRTLRERRRRSAPRRAARGTLARTRSHDGRHGGHAARDQLVERMQHCIRRVPRRARGSSISRRWSRSRLRMRRASSPSR